MRSKETPKNKIARKFQDMKTNNIISECEPRFTVLLNRTQQSYEENMKFKHVIYLCKDCSITAESPNNDLE